MYFIENVQLWAYCQSFSLSQKGREDVTIRPCKIPNDVSPSTLLNTLPHGRMTGFEVFMSVYTATSVKVTADVALDAPFIQAVASDSPEKAAGYKCWQHPSVR